MDNSERLMSTLIVELIRHRRALDEWTLALSAHTKAVQEWTRATRTISDVMERERELFDLRKATN